MGGIGKTLRQTFGNTGGELLGASIFEWTGKAIGADKTEVDQSKFAPTQDEAGFTQQLARIAAGEGKTASELQQEQGLQRAAAQAQSMAASQRGISPALAARLASQGLGELQQDVIGQSAINRLRENEAARNLLAQTYASQRGSRIEGAKTEFESGEASAGRAGKFLQTLGGGLMPHAGGAGGAAAGGAAAAKAKMAYGGAIDNPENDTVPAMLSPGEIVVPKSVVKMGPQASAQFVQALSRFVK